VIKMPITTDPTTDIGKVRLLITDVTEATALFTDEQIQAFLDMHGGSVFRAAAQGADTIAFSEVLVSKKIRTQDLALRDRAGEVDEDGETFAMDIVPYEDPLITSDRWTAFGAGW
jgi:hypothetical protein